MRVVLLILSLAWPVAASAQFLGGVADGMQSARQYELERRSGASYEQLVEQHRLNAIERQLRANAELLRELDRARFNRLYGPNPSLP